MAALGVPTTRALCIVSTGEKVRRSWYDDYGMERVMMEDGAVGTRVATSFLRFGQMELFYQRGELDLLRELAEHCLAREFSHLLVQHPSEQLSKQLVLMFDQVCERQASLVAEWLRVGYCQGNMNSDNAALGGVTLDYGPFAFMEKFNIQYNPWVGGGLPYSFGRQPQAAATNLVGLAQAFLALVEVVAKADGLSAAEAEALLGELRRGVSHTFVDAFNAKHEANCRAKLGLRGWDADADELWSELMRLMTSRSGVGLDYTLFFRALGTAPPPEGVEAWLEGASEAELLGGAVGHAALQPSDEWPSEHREEWAEWTRRYWRRVGEEARPADERVAEMNKANPKYILRNSMAAEAYEAAARGEYDVLRELHRVLQRPYEDQGEEVDARWATPTPTWARERPGLAFMS